MTAALDLDALERAALEATPGPWEIRKDPYSGELHYMVVGPNDAPLFDSVNRSPAADPFSEMADMQLAAAANPATILAMIGRLRAAEADLAVTVKLYEERQRLLEAIPPCEAHGACVPHAIEWVEAAKSAQSDAWRYRWLREQAERGTFGGVVTDASIDAAMKK